MCVQRRIARLFGAKYEGFVDSSVKCYLYWKKLIEREELVSEASAAVAKLGQRRRTQDPFP